MTVEKVGQVIEKAVYQAPKFVAEEIQFANQQAKIRKEIAAARLSSNSYYGDLVKDMTIKPIINIAKQIKKGVINYVNDVKKNWSSARYESNMRNEYIDALKIEKAQLKEGLKTRQLNTATDNARIAEDNKLFDAEQALELAADHDKKQTYLNLVVDLDNIETRKLQITEELKQLGVRNNEVENKLNELFPESKPKF